MATKLRITFSECEHDGDLQNYAEDVRSSGGKIVQSYVNSDEEEGVIVVEVEDKPAFVEKFKQTTAWEFVG